MLAHPGQQNNFEILPELKRAGLWGIELKHPVHNAYWQKIVLQAAADYGLFCTGGSDCHGSFVPSRHLGKPDVYETDIFLPGLFETPA